MAPPRHPFSPPRSGPPPPPCGVMVGRARGHRAGGGTWVAGARGGPRLPWGSLRRQRAGSPRRGDRGLERSALQGRLPPAAPCRPPGPRARSRGGGQDSRFPAARASGRFQPRPIFGESLSGLRHPGPGGGGGPRSGPRDRATAALPRSAGAWASGRGASGAAGGRDRARAGDRRSPAAAAAPAPAPAPAPTPARAQAHPALRGRLARRAPRPDYVTFPVHPTVDSSSQRGSELPRCARLRGYAQARGCGCVCVRGWRLLRLRAHPRAGTWN